MKVSVIVPSYNEGGLIRKCLGSLAKQRYPDLEVIVVDDGSTDGSLDLLDHFRLFKQEHLGPGAARNLGASKAGGRILIFVDADMTFEEDFVEKLVAPIVAGDSRGTFSKEECVANWENVWARCWNINEGWEPGRRHPKKYPDKQKVFRAILKSEFDKVGGFDPARGYNDDWSLSEKLGYKAQVAPDAVFYHQNPDNLIEVFQQAKWVAKRKYKFGVIGIIYNLLIYSFPDSVWVGFRKAIFKKEPLFLIFKVVYDLGAFLGILEYILTQKRAK